MYRYLIVLALVLMASAACGSPTSGPWGVDCNAAFSSFSACRAASPNSGRQLVVANKVYAIAHDETVTQSVTVPQGGGFNITAGKKLMMPVPQAGSYRIFYGSGTVEFTGGGEINPWWFWAGGEIGTATNQALQAGNYVKFPRSSYTVDPATAVIRIPNNRILDLGGSTLTRIGSNTTSRMIENYNYGGSNTDITLRNGLIVGTGNTVGVSDQGAGAFFYGVAGLTIENIKTSNTNGDGLGWRECTRVLARNIDIGNYGRNGISPTSGSGVIDNIRVSGTPIAGANPGIPIDVENDTSSESTDYSFSHVVAPSITFVDFYTAAAGAFAHKAKFSNCTFGPGYKPLRAISQNNTTATSFVVDASNILKGQGPTGPAVEIDNVNGIVLNGPTLDVSASTGAAANINIVHTVSGLSVFNPKFIGGAYGLQTYDTARLNNSFFSGGNLGTVYLQGTGNVFKGVTIDNLRLLSADTQGNLFDVASTYNLLTAESGASLSNNYFGTFGRGLQASGYYTKEASVPDGTTYDMTIPLPSSVGIGNGRLLFVMAGYSHKGNTAHWAHLVATVRNGDDAQSVANTISSQGAAGISIAVLSVTQTSITLRLTHQFQGKLSVTILG